MSNDAHGPSSTRVFVINLDRAPGRMAEIDRQLSAFNLTFERVAAIDGGTLSFPHRYFDEGAYRTLHGRRTNPAEVGCYLSHIECARRLIDSSAEFALILEDDLQFALDFAEVLRAAIANADSWHLLRLSTVNRGRLHSYSALSHGRDLAVALTREKGSGAYVINRRAAKWFLNDLVPMKLPFDIAFDLEFRAGLNTSFVSPPPVEQCNGLPSQIQPRKRRSNHLSRWHYATVRPFRAMMEVEGFLIRASKLTWLRLLQPSGQVNPAAIYGPPIERPAKPGI